MAEADSSGAVTKTYGYKPGSTWTTDPLFMTEGGKYYFYHNDHLGTPQKMTAVNGAVVWAALYSSFGEAQVLPSSTVENNLRFAGQYYDKDTGLHYNQQRYYGAKTGRYLKSDPIGLEGGINIYLYVKNNPLNNSDPFGLSDMLEHYDYFHKGKPIPGYPHGIEVEYEIKCDWDRLADCINCEIVNTPPDTVMYCVRYAISRGQDMEAFANCFISTAIEIGECYTTHCKLIVRTK